MFIYKAFVMVDVYVIKKFLNYDFKVTQIFAWKSYLNIFLFETCLLI